MAVHELTPFGRLVKKRLIDLGMKHSDLCQQIGCSIPYLSGLLVGYRGPGKYLEPICRVLGMEIPEDELKEQKPA
jgi:hypothetical protein